MATNLITGTKRWKQFITASTDGVQDPIYLTFALDFFPPTLKSHPKGDNIYWDTLLRVESNPKDMASLNSTFEWSTHAWLDRYGSDWTNGNPNNGVPSAAGHLLAMIVLLNQLQSSPWYFQSILGVDQLWKGATQIKAGAKPVEITVNCIDSIKQPLLRMAEHYRRAIYDFDRVSYTVPDNMRTLNMEIKIYEIRDIIDRTSALDQSGSYQNVNTQPWLEDGLHQMIFHLHQCEFDFSDILGGPTNTEFKAYTEERPFSTSFKIKSAWVEERSVSSLVEDHQGLGLFAGVLDTMSNKANAFLKSAIGIPQQILGNITNGLQTSLENQVMGNVYNNSTGPSFNRVSPVGPTSKNLIGTNAYPTLGPNQEIKTLGNAY